MKFKNKREMVNADYEKMYKCKIKNLEDMEGAEQDKILEKLSMKLNEIHKNQMLSEKITKIQIDNMDKSSMKRMMNNMQQAHKDMK